MSESFNEVGPRMIATFGHSIWQGAVITLIALAVICLFGKRSAELRYRILFVALTMTALLVPVTYCVLAPHGQSPIASAAGEQERGRLERLGTPSPRGPLDTGLSSSEVVPEANSLAPAQTSQWLLAIYALGVSLMCLRLAIGFSRTAGYVQRASAVNQPVVEELLERLWPMTGLRRKPFVGVCHRVASPVLVGLLRPAFLLPPSLLTNLSPTELESILLHELAHLYRRDHWAQLVQRLIEALLFFNPAIWFLSRNLSVERELCCDDLAIRWGTEPCDLAEALVSAAAIRKPQAIEVGSLVLAATGERPSTLARRVRRLLGVPADQHRIIVPRYLFALFIPLLLVLVATASQIGDDEQSTNVAAVESRETVALTTTDEAVPQQPANSETRVSKQDRDRDDASSTDVVEPSRAVFRLSGNVIDSRGTAIPNATLAIWGLGGVSSMTGTTTKLYQADAQGEFRIEFPMPQINDKVWPIAWVYAPGHAMAVFSLRLDDKDIELEGISVQLNEPEVSRHRIVGPKGKPVTNALVYPEYVSVRGFQLNDNTLAAAGPKSFIARLPEELVELVADRSNDDGWVTVDGTRLSDRRGLRVRSKEFGTQTISDLQPKELRLLPTGSLRGRVAGEELEQYEGIDFLIQTDEGNVGGVATVKLNDRGEFFVPKLAAGRGHILFSNWNPSLPMHPIAGGRWRVDEEEEMNLTIDLVKPVTVHGRVLLEDTNEPLPNASVTINSLQSPINGARTKTDREGRFTLRVAPGRCLRQLTSFGGGEESKVLFDEYDYPRFDPFDLDDASSEVTFDPWFVSRRANVRIRLVDTSGRPVASKTVAIHRKQSAFLIGDQETTDSHGECEMKVREWKLMANNRDVRNAYQWSLVTEAPKKREFLWKGIPLRVLESTANSVTLQFSPHDAEVQLNFPH